MKGLNDEDYWSVYDFTNLVCNKDKTNSYSRKTFQNLVADESEFQEEVVKLFHNFQFPGQGQRPTPCMTIRGLQRLLMILGGKVASEYRAIVETTFTRVMAGDRSLIQVIESNATNGSAINTAFRNALANDPSPGGILPDSALDRLTLKRKQELDELAYAERLEELQLKRAKRIQLQIDLYATVSPNGMIDDRARVLFKDDILNLRLKTPTDSGGIVSTATYTDGSNLPVTISAIASDIGLKFADNDYKAIGKKVKEAYVAKYSDNPPKHEQICSGAVRQVNSYTQRDKDLIVNVLRGFKASR